MFYVDTGRTLIDFYFLNLGPLKCDQIEQCRLLSGSGWER